ncbi:hypothetical protein [uncultured Hymenobacter sp.]|uniref:hypothetical protein n=1 Tax=uncultured Hymenobacter sp. TaxID=170016 RepID=UPI0035C9D912
MRRLKTELLDGRSVGNTPNDYQFSPPSTALRSMGSMFWRGDVPLWAGCCGIISLRAAPSADIKALGGAGSTTRPAVQRA